MSVWGKVKTGTQAVKYLHAITRLITQLLPYIIVLNVCVLSYSHIFGMIMILRNKKKVLLWPFHCSHYLYYYCYPTINFLGTVVMVIKQSLNWGGIERDGESLSKGKWDRVKGRLSAIFGPYFHDHNKMLNEGIQLWCCIFMAFLSPLVEPVTWWTTT